MSRPPPPITTPSLLMPTLDLDPATTALVVIDLQQGIAGGTTVLPAARDIVRELRQYDLLTNLRQHGGLLGSSVRRG